jgi:Putative adhesin
MNRAKINRVGNDTKSSATVKRRSLALAVACILTAAIPSFASVIGTFDRSFQVNGPVNLEVLTKSGDITVRPGSSNTVTVHAKIQSGSSWFGGDHKAEVQELQTNPPIRQNGNGIRIDYVNMRDISVDYEITVPAETTLRSHTGSGDQLIEGLKGNIDLESGSGDLKLARLTGELRFQTGSGNIIAREVSGPARVKAGSGDIHIDETGAGDVEIRTGSGNITVKGINGGFHAEAGSGNIHGSGVATNLWNVRTGSGNVNLGLPSDAAFDVDVSSSSGNVTMGHPVATTVQGRVQESRKSVVGKVRGGGPTVSVHTGSGDITVD